MSRFISCYAECRYAECHYAEYHYAEYHYAEYYYAEYHYAECHYAECCYAECRGAKKHISFHISFHFDLDHVFILNNNLTKGVNIDLQYKAVLLPHCNKLVYLSV